MSNLQFQRAPLLKFSIDCIHYVGEKPCRFNRLCEGCEHYAPPSGKILLIKLASMGDVLRTTTLLNGLAREYPGHHLTWLVDRSSLELLSGLAEIHRLLPYDEVSLMRLSVESFDLAICLDKEIRATSLMHKVNAKEKVGFTFDPMGGIAPVNPASEYTFALGLSDHLKFTENTKTYQECIFECVRIPYMRDHYHFHLPGEDLKRAGEILCRAGLGPDEHPVGLNTGSGRVFATKKWPADRFAALARRLHDALGVTVILLGGAEEEERNRAIETASGAVAKNIGTGHSLKVFAAMVGHCSVVVTADSLAMHLAIAMGTPSTVLFGPTCHQEVDLYDRGMKLIGQAPCAPCYKSECPYEHECMKDITVDRVFEAVADQLSNSVST